MSPSVFHQAMGYKCSQVTGTFVLWTPASFGDPGAAGLWMPEKIFKT